MLVRHGQSTANATSSSAANRMRDPDVPLTRVGEREAAAVGRWLRSLPADAAPDAVWSSPYLRAAETARLALAAAGSRLPVRTDERLRDREPGVTEGATAEEVRQRWPGEAERRQRLGKFYYRAPGGESWADVALRIRFFLADLDRTGARRVLITAHDTPIVLFRYACEGMSEAEVLDLEQSSPLRNASISRLVRTGDGGWSTAAYNAVAHLDEPGP